MISDNDITLYAVRHGETEYNRSRLMQGRRIDAPLNARGLLQADALAERFDSVRLDTIVSSPLLRARQTAEVVAERHPDSGFEIDADIAEMSWGVLEGQSIDEVGDLLRDFGRRWKRGAFEDRVGGGESILDVSVRAGRFLDGLRTRFAGQTVLAVMHGRFLRVMLAMAQPEPDLRTMDRYGHANTGVYRLRTVPGGYSIDLANCTAHLKPLEADA